MATVHPSRLGLVPALKHSLPARPPQTQSALASTSSTSRDSSPVIGTPLSREEELRRKLLSRKQASISGQPPRDAKADGHGERGMRGKELIDSDTRPATLGILGRASRQRAEEELERRNEGRSRSRSGSVSRTLGERDISVSRDEEESSPRARREDSDEPPSRRDNDSSRGSDRSDIRGHEREADRRARNGNHNREYRSPDRGGGRDRQYDSQRLRDDYATWKARHDRTNDRVGEDFNRERVLGRREDALRGQDGSYRPSAEGSRDNSRRPSPSYRADSRPDRGHNPSGEQGGARPPIWLNPGGPMPPFPPNRRLGPADFEQRRLQRETMAFSIWPPSPTSPYRDSDDEEKSRSRRKDKKSRKSRARKYSDTESSDSEYERRRRRCKEKQRRAKRYDDESSDDTREKKRRRSQSVKTRTQTRSLTPQLPDDGEAQWVEKGAEGVLVPSRKELTGAGMDYSDDDEVGPRLPSEAEIKARRAHFEGMNYGEAEAMALYAADGRRIPRRGEIGMDSETIEKYEEAGYVMSGSRHKRMNAVRLRKENQVINAEEKRAILKLQREENVRKEGAIVSQFREMLEEKLREGKAGT